jgi:hypothetical protein
MLSSANHIFVVFWTFGLFSYSFPMLSSAIQDRLGLNSFPSHSMAADDDYTT